MNSKSVPPGPSTSGPEVTNVSSKGFWLLLDSEELFLPFADFPWFEQATIGQLNRVERPHQGHLYWPDLDIDLAVDSIRNPRDFPLVSRPGRT